MRIKDMAEMEPILKELSEIRLLTKKEYLMPNAVLIGILDMKVRLKAVVTTIEEFLKTKGV